MQALKSGKYKVRGSVRNKDDPSKLEFLKETFEDQFEKLELVNVDLLKPETVRAAIEGCDHVIHVASPFALQGGLDAFVKPAVEGTNTVLQACLDFGIKRLIVTASMITVYGANNIKEKYTEADFSPPEGKNITPYGKSKIMAENCIIEFRKKIPNDSPLEIITIHPGFITGNFLF